MVVEGTEAKVHHLPADAGVTTRLNLQATPRAIRSIRRRRTGTSQEEGPLEVDHRVVAILEAREVLVARVEMEEEVAVVVTEPDDTIMEEDRLILAPIPAIRTIRTTATKTIISMGMDVTPPT